MAPSRNYIALYFNRFVTVVWLPFSTMNVLTVVYLICTIQLCYSTNFGNLCGYSLPAHTFASCNTVDDMSCAQLCAATDLCIGFQYVADTGDCNLFDTVRNVIATETECSFYIKTTETNMTNVIYQSQGVCPDGWTVSTSQCTLAVSEEECGQYASFLSATYSNGTCVVKKLSYTYSCSSNWTYAAETYRGNLTYVNASMKLCSENGGGYFATIHGLAEQTVYANQRASAVSAGLAIGLVPNEPNNYIVGNWSMIWYDGTSVNYNNWGPGPEIANATTSQFKVTLMTGDNQWHTNLPDQVFTDNFYHVACKADANKTISTT
uniref:C-type lectin domain-containing protein n=1 Tax=Panagrellus redivivus TaxID=6233 RepID=A0A7E4V3G5_PANRE